MSKKIPVPPSEVLDEVLRRCTSVRAAAKELGVAFDTLKRWLGDRNPRLGVRTCATKPDGPLSPHGRRRTVEQFLRDYPNPLALLRRTRPGLFGAAKRLGLTDDELTADCYFAAVRAARKFDPEKGTAFASFALYEIWTVVRTTIGDRVKRRREKPYEE